MPVTLHHAEILSRANHFAKEFADARHQLGEAQNFIRGLCDVLGFSHKRLVSFEQRVKKLGGGRGRIDGFYPGQLLIEMKSRGEKLDVAYQQATDYLPGLSGAELPECILVSDFAHMHLHRRDGQSPQSLLQSRRRRLVLQSLGRARSARCFLLGLHQQVNLSGFAPRLLSLINPSNLKL